MTESGPPESYSEAVELSRTLDRPLLIQFKAPG